MAATVFRPRTPEPRRAPASLPTLLWLMWRDPLRIWSRRHFREAVLWGEGRFGRAMTVSDPAGIKHVLLDRANIYEKGQVQRRVLGPMLAQGMLLAEGEAWKRARRTVAPLFAPRRLANATARMHAIAEARVDQWLGARVGQVLDIDREMTRLTFEMLSATLFSDEIGDEAAGFERAVNRYAETAARADPLDVMGAPDWIPRAGRILGGGAAQWFENRVSKLVRERRERLARGDAPDDLMTALLKAQDPETGSGLSDTEVSSNILTFILAGHETTARALGWTFHLLARSPDVRARVEEEAEGLDIGRDDWVERACWTRAVFEESMRLFPPAPVITRSAVEEDEVCGVAVHPGTTILISPWVLHRHESLWEDPGAFRPERFLPGEREKIDRFAYLPFGGGPRICVGAAFAMQEAMLILLAAARRVRLDRVGDAEPTPTQRITLRAKEGIRLRLARRPTTTARSAAS
jgi:cytochrome P450